MKKQLHPAVTASALILTLLLVVGIYAWTQRATGHYIPPPGGKKFLPVAGGGGK